MKKIMTKALLFFLFFLSQQTLAFHKTLTNYSELLNALKEGHNIRAVIAVNKCSPSSPEYQTSDEILWSVDFTNFYKTKFPHSHQLTEGIAVAYNKLKQTENGPVYDYAWIRVFTNGDIDGYSEFINPKDFSSIKKTTYHCRLDKDIVTLYDRG